MALGVDSPVPTAEEAAAHRYTERERAYVLSQRERLVHGAPDQVRAKLLALAEQFAADELMILTIPGDYASRRRSYELIASAFGLGV
jgi:alkanesulfonate monooxygenase SsuD/methylene tetrahydromethanopterin reductase-like flavin-dependent oxidoreductase (luciferase family)